MNWEKRYSNAQTTERYEKGDTFGKGIHYRGFEDDNDVDFNGVHGRENEHYEEHKENVDCPDCRGRGKVEDPHPNPRLRLDQQIKLPCKRCRGLGTEVATIRTKIQEPTVPSQDDNL